MAQPSDSIHVHNATEADAARQTLIARLGIGSVFTRQPSNSLIASSPILMPSGVTCRRLTCGLSNGVTAYAWVWMPQTPNTTMLAVVQGHDGTFESYGLGELIRAAVVAGHTVVGTVMPGGTDRQSGGTASHNGRALLEFIEPMIIALNFLQSPLSLFNRIVMTGISGGGWTTTLVAALDNRIDVSIPIAGSLPLYIDVPNRDYEQLLPGIFADFSYLDLYLMATTGGSRQLQLLHSDDECCFRLSQYNSGPPYAGVVSELAASFDGEFELRWINQSQHAISEADRNIVLQILSETEPSEPEPPMPTTITKIIDNTSPSSEFSVAGGTGPTNIGGQAGVWTPWTGQGYSGSLLSTDSSGNSRPAKFTFNVNPGTYNLYLTWVRHDNRSTAVPVTVVLGVLRQPVQSINQQQEPSGFVYNGINWKPIFSVDVAAASTIVVEIDKPPSGYAIADAVLLQGTEDEATPPPPTGVDWIALEAELHAAASSVLARYRT